MFEHMFYRQIITERCLPFQPDVAKLENNFVECKFSVQNGANLAQLFSPK